MSKKFDVIKFVSKQGFEVYHGLIEEENTRGIIYADKETSKKIILVNEIQSTNYKRFIVLYLYYDYLKNWNDIYYSNSVTDDNYDLETLKEVEDKLVDDDVIENYIIDKGINCDYLISKFEVPDFIVRDKIKKIGGKTK